MKDHSFSFFLLSFYALSVFEYFYDLTNLIMSNDPSILYISCLIFKFHKFLPSQSNLVGPLFDWS